MNARCGVDLHHHRGTDSQTHRGAEAAIDLQNDSPVDARGIDPQEPGSRGFAEGPKRHEAIEGYLELGERQQEAKGTPDHERIGQIHFTRGPDLQVGFFIQSSAVRIAGAPSNGHLPDRHRDHQRLAGTVGLLSSIGIEHSHRLGSSRLEATTLLIPDRRECRIDLRNREENVVPKGIDGHQQAGFEGQARNAADATRSLEYAGESQSSAIDTQEQQCVDRQLEQRCLTRSDPQGAGTHQGEALGLDTDREAAIDAEVLSRTDIEGQHTGRHQTQRLWRGLDMDFQVVLRSVGDLVRGALSNRGQQPDNRVVAVEDIITGLSAIGGFLEQHRAHADLHGSPRGNRVRQHQHT